MLRARFLGIPHITLGTDAQEMPLSGRELALFTYLCVTRQPHSRGILADLLWQDLSEQEAKNNLRYPLRNLRKVIGDYLLVDSQTVGIHPDLPHWFDTTILTTYLVPNGSSPTTEVEPLILQELLDLYTGEFLTGFQIQNAMNFDSWLVAQRQHFHDLLIHGLQLSTQQHTAAGEYDVGLAINRYLLTLEPWREEAHRQRMILLAASGQRSAALMQYEICCQTLEEELDVPPMNETTSLYRQIKSGQWFLGPQEVLQHHNQRVAVRSYPQITPVQSAEVLIDAKATVPMRASIQVDLGSMPGVDHFVGRHRELAGLRRWVDDEGGQLIAILGIGGQGKSALAAYFVQQQAAQAQRKPNQHHAQLANGGFTSVKNTQPLFTGSVESQLAAPNGVQHIIWRSLTRKPTCIEILQGWLQQLNISDSELSTNFDQLVTRLFTVLEERKCLFVLDAVEAVLQHGRDDHGSRSAHHDRADHREDLSEPEAYETLFRLFIERKHRSCLVLTSRIRPTTLTHLDKRNHQIHCLELDGLALEDGTELMAAHGLGTDVAIQQQLYQSYSGNPRLLIQMANLIYDLFEGDVAAFLREELLFFGEIDISIAEQVARFSPLELQVMEVLVGTEQMLSRQAIWENLPLPTAKQNFYHALRNLQRACMIQQRDGRYKLPDVMALYLAERVREHAC